MTMKLKLNNWLFLSLVLVVPLMAFGIYFVTKDKLSELPVFDNPSAVAGQKGKDHVVGDFNLMNQYGKSVSRASWDNKITIANFFFTRCPSICPKMMLHLKEVQAAFKNDERIQIASFSVDPDNDSVAKLKDYVRQFNIDDQRWDLLTGDKKEIYRLARNGFMLVATEGDGGPTDFIHSEQLVLLDTKHRIRGYYNGTSDTETKQLIKDIKKLEHEEF